MMDSEGGVRRFTDAEAAISRESGAWALVERCPGEVRAYVSITDAQEPTPGTVNGLECLSWHAPDLDALEAIGRTLIDAVKKARDTGDQRRLSRKP